MQAAASVAYTGARSTRNRRRNRIEAEFPILHEKFKFLTDPRNDEAQGLNAYIDNPSVPFYSMKAWKNHPHTSDGDLVKGHDDNSAINRKGWVGRTTAIG